MYYEYCVEYRITLLKTIGHEETLYSEIAEVSAYSESILSARDQAIQKISEIRNYLVQKGLIETSKNVDHSFSLLVKLISYSSLPPDFKAKGFSNKEFHTSIFLPLADFPLISPDGDYDLTEERKNEIDELYKDTFDDIKEETVYKATQKESELIIYKTSQLSRVLRFANDEYRFFVNRSFITEQLKSDKFLNYRKEEFDILIPSFYAFKSNRNLLAS